MTAEIKKVSKAQASYGDRGVTSKSSAGYVLLVDGIESGVVTCDKGFMCASEWKLKVNGGYVFYRSTLKELKALVANNPEKLVAKK